MFGPGVVRMRQTVAAAAAAAGANSQSVIATFAQEHSSVAASTSATISASSVTVTSTTTTNARRTAVTSKLEKENAAVCEGSSRNAIQLDEKRVQRVVEVSANEPSKTLSQKIAGGYCTDELYVYVRGRGRGRYVCDRCGIRCKKPSMLKKHIR
ncbi:unnamed protein product [Gongylonema pulchrum]|uniref:C2H2-type domain-containing protein n=1 Tax=Gongylonema pulchrum TaxID=637853 RepID=A0A183EQL4_9BILA|nr:unnamed protein product [Gongylonema pulchrum]